MGKRHLLQCFEQQLEIVRGFKRNNLHTTNPAELAVTMDTSFIVELRAALLERGEEVLVELPHLGKFLRTTTLEWHPSDELITDVSGGVIKLPAFLQNDPTLPAQYVTNRKSEALCLGREHRINFFQLLLTSITEKDSYWENVNFRLLNESIFLLMHDTICYGMSMEIETIGTVGPMGFVMDPIMHSCLENIQPWEP